MMSFYSGFKEKEPKTEPQGKSKEFARGSTASWDLTLKMV